MAEEMSDAKVRAELERIGLTYSAWWDLLKENNDLSSEEGKMLRLLAESQWALGEIIELALKQHDSPIGRKIFNIARHALGKEE